MMNSPDFRCRVLRRAFCTIALLVLLAGSNPVVADSHDAAPVTLDEAIALVRDRADGKVLRAESKRRDDALVYEIRVLTDDGHVRTFVVDARTGKVR